jgi:threonine aldolase
MDFRSDNTSGVLPEIMAALNVANHGTASSYGADSITEILTRRFSELFERDVAVFPVATGTAANVLALATLTPPWGVIYCHEAAHIAVDECAAPEFYTSGAQLARLQGLNGKIEPHVLEAHISGVGVVHHAQPAVISLSQASEAGTVYSPSETAAIAEVARRHHLGIHVDGARFANAIAHLACSPADLTWRAGVDALSFGATKNGALAAEAVIFFDPERAKDLGYRRKRGGHLFSKMRFLSAQIEAYLDDNLWLASARHANSMASKLGAGLAAIPGVRLRYPVEANEVFVELPEAAINELTALGFLFHRWGDATTTCIRLVTSFATESISVDGLIAATRRIVEAQSSIR